MVTLIVAHELFMAIRLAQCMRCHSYGDYGGTVGPRLNGVASRLTREQILESLIKPSARIAAGFGTVVLELKDGSKINGILLQEKPTGLLLKIGDKPDTLILSSNITKRTNGASSMPPHGIAANEKRNTRCDQCSLYAEGGELKTTSSSKFQVPGS